MTSKDADDRHRQRRSSTIYRWGCGKRICPSFTMTRSKTVFALGMDDSPSPRPKQTGSSLRSGATLYSSYSPSFRYQTLSEIRLPVFRLLGNPYSYARIGIPKWATRALSRRGVSAPSAPFPSALRERGFNPLLQLLHSARPGHCVPQTASRSSFSCFFGGRSQLQNRYLHGLKHITNRC